jgi:hypothetical protein
MTDIELERTALVISDRVAYIGSYLSGATTLYSDRFDIIDLRLTKNMGTLKEIMSAKKGIEVVDVIFSDRDDTETVHNKYFIVKKSLLNGDFYMRIFTDNADGLSIGDNCYILTDDESLPEIESLITDIVDGRVQDYVNTIYHEDGTSIPVYVDCKKIFFGSNIFSDEYLETDNFRIIKEI